jgi:predicted phosphodiesterase
MALISDIHGNSVALDAVIADARAGGRVDRWWVLGDIIALGHDPVGVLERLTALDNVACLAGNTERYVVSRALPYPQLADVAADPSLLPRLVDVAASFAWTRGAVTQAGWLDWLARLPQSQRCVLPDGTRVLGVHASPRADDGPGIDPRISAEELGALLAGCEADVVFGGHTHWAVDRVVAGIRAVNLGSVSNSNRPDRRASYVVLNGDESGHRIEHRTVDYDHGAVLRAIDAVSHPSPHFLKQFQQVLA